MQKLANVDYWYPCTRKLKTIDSVAKVSIGGRNVVGLLQITKSNSHKIDANVLDEYATRFPGSDVEYFALVPDKTTSDNFRLDPASPKTNLPLKVAYLDNDIWKSILQSSTD